VARYNRLSVDGKRDFTAWRKSKAYAWPPTTAAEVIAMVAEMVTLEREATREHDTYEAGDKSSAAGEGFPTTTHARRRRNETEPDAGDAAGTEKSKAPPTPVPTTPDDETPNETSSGEARLERKADLRKSAPDDPPAPV
jgi:hypothetical protein